MSVTIASTENITVKTGLMDNLSDMLKNVPKAQYWLDGQVMNDCVPLMPINTGAFIAQTRQVSAALQGTGKVCVAAGVQGRYLYEGKVMVDAQTGRGAMPITTNTGELIFRHRLGAKLMPTSRPLTYTNPNAVPHWFDEAKNRHLDEWKKGALNVIRGKI